MPESLLRSATLLKESLLHRCFPASFAKFLRTPFLQSTSGRLLLNIALSHPFYYYTIIPNYNLPYQANIKRYIKRELTIIPR